MSVTSSGNRRLRIPRIKFVWGGASVIRGRWYLGLFGLYDREEGKREDGLAVSVRGLLAWGAGGLVAAWLAGATLLYSIWDRNPYNLLTYRDALFYPVRQAALQPRKGQAFINQGLDLWRQGKFSDAARLLRLGLARVPHDVRARTRLAQYFLLANSRPSAQAVLQEGLSAEYPGRAYLTALFQVAEEGDDYALVLSTCDRYRAGLSGEANLRERRWLETTQFGALIALGRLDDALALASTDAAWSETAAEEKVAALLALKRLDEASRVLAELRNRTGIRQEVTIIQLQVRAAREAQRFDEMDRALADLRRAQPNQPQPIVFGVVELSKAGRTKEARAALEDYFFRMAKLPAEVQIVAEPLEEAGDLPLVERCAEVAAERGYPKEPFQRMLVQAHVRRGNWAAAQRILKQMSVVSSKTPAQTRKALDLQIWQTWMNALVEAAINPVDTAQQPLLQFLRGRPWSIAIYRRSAEAMRLAGRLETERDALAIAAGACPASSWVQARQAEVAAKIAARSAVAVAAPVPEPPRWTERTFLEQLDQLVHDAKWSETDALLREVRDLRPVPSWLDQRDDRVRLAQLQIAQARGATTDMLTAVRVYLNGNPERSKTVIELARGYQAHGDKPAALALAKEVQRKSPDYPPMQRLLAELEPKKAK